LVRFNFRWALFLAVFALSSVYFFVFGESGILERMNLERNKKTIEEKLNELKNENRSLSSRLNKYRQEHYSGDDYLESGYIKPGEKVIMFSGPGDKNAPKKTEEKGEGLYSGLLPYLRMIWVGISVALVIGLFLYNRKLKSRETS
jgi:cell division protein FtsB